MEPPSIINEDGWVHTEDLSPTVILYRNIGEEEARYIAGAMASTPTVAVVDVKGGVKKTTAAVHTAFALHREARGGDGARVLIADCDQYHSVSDWQRVAAEETEGEVADPWPDEVIVVASSGDNFHHDIVAAVREFAPDYVVVDTPPNDPDAALRALLLSDVMLTPTGPFAMDIRRLSYGLRAAAEAANLRGRPIVPRAMITGARLHTNVYKNARRYLRKMGLPFLSMPIPDLIGHAENFGTSLRKLHGYEHVIDDLLPLLDKTSEG